MINLVAVHPNAYKDSVRLLEATRTMFAVPGIEWAWALMATPANIDVLVNEGFDANAAGAGPNDLIFAVRAANEESARAALSAAETTLLGPTVGIDTDKKNTAQDLRAALKELPDANIAVISVPGPFATLEAHKALTAGLHVFLFSDNVPIEDEIVLKQRAQSLGRLVMGPGAGTGRLAGIGLGFANRVGSGPVGIVAASGTGAQEVMSLLDRWGVGISHVIGVGGRDLSSEVGGVMTESAIRALDADKETQAIVLVSKPPSPDIAQKILSLAGKPVIASLIGLHRDIKVPANVAIYRNLESGALHTLDVLNRTRPDITGNLAKEIADALPKLTSGRTRLVGLFSGGTLCSEAMTIAKRYLGPIYSNIPLEDEWTLAAAPASAHICLDLGEEEYTKGNPHPMIDAEARVPELRRQVQDPTVGVVLLDVIIGDGAHPNPAGVLAPVAADIVRSGAAVVVYVLGTERDPQGFHAQRDAFRQAGCIVTETAARAAFAATALILRNPALVNDGLANSARS